MSDAERVLVKVTDFKCRHNKFNVDPRLGTVECGICGEKLNPMWVLDQLCNHESRVWVQYERVRELAIKTRDKLRCKCQHCGKMTRIVR